MYRSVLAALLLGMLPLPSPLFVEAPTLREMAIAPPASPLHIPERLSASGVLVLDMQGGQQIYGKQVDVQRPMASLTKLMTALIIVENHGTDEWVKVPKEAGETEGNNIYLPIGEQFTVGGLLSALLIASANDAANTLAVFHGGSVEGFVKEMNLRAKALGLKDTHYANPTGLDSRDQWSTPQDVAWLASFVLRIPDIRERLGRRGQRVRSRHGGLVHLVHTHALLHADIPVLAGKTGTTNGAKECLLSLVENNGREYLIILMRSLHRYVDMEIVLDVLEGNEDIM